MIGILAAGILGVIFQGNTFGGLLSAAYGGYTSNSGVEAVDNLLTKGEFESMMYTVSLVICGHDVRRYHGKDQPAAGRRNRYPEKGAKPAAP